MAHEWIRKAKCIIMKKLLIAVFALTLLAGTANAQDQKYKVKGNKVKVEGGGYDRDMEGLNLTAEQKNRVAAINEDYRRQMQSLRSENLSAEDRKSRFESLRQQHMENIRAVLTEEQRAKWDETKQRNGKDRMKIKERGKRPDMMNNGMERSFEKLNLTEDQRNRIATINQEYRQQMENLRNENLSQNEMRTRHETLQKQHMENIRAVLTNEQRTQWDSMKEEYRGKEGNYRYKEKSKTNKS